MLKSTFANQVAAFTASLKLTEWQYSSFDVAGAATEKDPKPAQRTAEKSG